MNKKEATRTLVETIRDSYPLKIIENSALQTKILIDAKGYSEITCKEDQKELITTKSDDEYRIHESQITRKYKECKENHNDSIRRLTGRVTEANYIFLDTDSKIACSAPYDSTTAIILIFSKINYFALIGEDEIEILKEKFKGDLTGKIKEASETLGIVEDLQVNYTQLLKEEPEKFREYFRKITDSKRKKIIEENWQIFENKQVDNYTNKFLTKNYKHLIEEIARDKLTE